MEIVLATLADGANVTLDGKMNLLGVFDTLAVPAFPASHPAMVLALRLRAEYPDQHAPHSLSARLVDEDGRILWAVEGQIRVGPIQPGQFTHSDQLFSFRNAVFPGVGRYHFSVTLDSVTREIVFQVVRQPDATAGADE